MACVTLESQLKRYAEEEPEQYEVLLTTWRHNKQRCESLLSSVSEHFMYYSSHSAEHSRMVIRNIERILDDNRIALLSATDIWLILHSAYMHDLGMVIPDDDYRNAWKSPEFQEFLNEKIHSDNPDLRKASQFLKDLLNGTGKANEDEREKKERLETFRNADDQMESRTIEDWPIMYRSSAAILISEFFRPKHAERIRRYVERPYENGKLSFDNANNSRIVNLIQRVSCLHTRDSDELISTLERETVGFGRDIAHPRFIAELLRLGDALDLDAGRFSIDFTFLHGKRPEYSELHYKLHNAVTDFLIKPEQVVYRANCEDRETYRLVCQLTRYLQEEFRFCASNWPKIVPDNFPGPVPQFVLSPGDVKFKGKPDDMGLTGLRFTLSERKAFQLLEGANIYNEPMTFIRELLQNALDASKIQLWRDLNARYDYRRRLPPEVLDNLERIQPYDIPPDLYDNYPVEILIRPCQDENRRPDETTEIIFSDHGTGFTVESVKQMCRVTESYSDPRRAAELERMPKWLKPTGGFGIGLQSAFSVADMISIDTQSEDGTRLSIEIDSPQQSGAVRLDIEEDKRKRRPDGRGSAITIRLKGKAEERFDFATLQTPSHDERLYRQVKSFFDEKCRALLFPMTAKWNGKSCSPEGESFYALFQDELPGYDKSQHYGHYYYRLSTDGTQIEIWDKKDAWLAHWELSHIPLLRSVPNISWHFFRGIRINDIYIPKTIIRFSYVCYRIDAYGLDANRSLQLNRNAFTIQGREDFSSALEGTFQLYMNILWDRLRSMEKFSVDMSEFLLRNHSALSKTLLYNKSDSCYRLAFWLSVKPEVRQELSRFYSEWLRDTRIITQCLEIQTGNWQVHNMPVEDYIKNYAEVPRLVLYWDVPFSNNTAYISKSLQQMDSPYSKCERIIFSKIAFTDKTNSDYTLQYLPELIKNVAAICTIPSVDEGISILFPVTRSKSNEALYVNLTAKNNIMLSDWYSDSRCYLPVLPEYKLLAIDKQGELENLSRVNCGFDFPDSRIVISPITKEDILAIGEKSREEFLTYLAETEAFHGLVRYVEAHTEQSVNAEKITELYLELAGEIWDARHPENDAEPVADAKEEEDAE